MRHRISLAIAFTFIVSPVLSFAVATADPQPMKPVEKDKRRIAERNDDRNRDRDRRAERDRTRGRYDDNDRQIEPSRRTGRRPRSIDDGQWVLGLTGDDTDTGVRVTNVVRGSAADRVGLERDDVIINVGGYQVGVIDGRRYDLGEELQRQADRAGRVTLLIQNRRGRRLENVNVQMQWVQSRRRVVGTVSYRERIALPPEAVCFVELVEVDFRGRPLRVMEKQLVRMGTGSSAPFSLEIDPRSIDPNQRYAVQARIEMNGRVLMETQDTYYVITQGGPERIDLLLRGRVTHRGPVHRGGGKPVIRRP